MRLFLPALLLASLLLFTLARADSPSAASQPAPVPSRVDELSRDLQKSCRYWEADRIKEKSGVATREFTHFAHDLLALNADPAKAQTYALRAFAEQDMDVNSKSYGTVPWTVGVHVEHEDANAIEFTCLPLGPILTRYRSKLSPDFLAKIQPHVTASLVAIRRHKVSVAYTNIFLMKSCNLLLLGEAASDHAAVVEAIANLDAWLNYTRTNGVGEYNSPTYLETQINSASTAYNNVSNPQAKKRLRLILNYLWADACANYSPQSDNFVGALSRNYDFSDATGPADRYFFLAGLREEPPVKSIFNDQSGPLCDALQTSNLQSPGYWPAPDILALAKLPQKEFTSRYGPDPGMDRTLYLTPDFALGSAGHAYGPQDRTISASLFSSKQLPPVSLYLDPFDMPDGSLRITEKDGHSKPQHLQPRQVVVQDRSTLLALFDLASPLHTGEFHSLGLNLLLPSKADSLWLDGVKVDTSQPLNLPCKPNSVLVLREGKTVLMARFVGVEGLDGQAPVFALKNDVAKGDLVRLVAYLYQGPARTFSDPSAHAAVLLILQPCPDDDALQKFLAYAGAAKPTLVNSKDVWTASYDGLEAAMNDKDKPVSRKIRGVDVNITGPGRLNGQDLGLYLHD